ncbi:hypothetical protein UPYG_G00048970 [Umbra pygmaea]|uniref:C-type lectin domain-containing protein n=1 Tax=Umbra pygmaea TaxID=75934 RepID=A0ABD0XRK2_UMBPY
MEIDDSSTTNDMKPLEKVAAQHSVRKAHFLAAFLGLLCVLQLIVIICLLTYQRKHVTSDNTLKMQDKDQLQISYNNLTNERDQLKTSYNTLAKEKDQLQTSYNTLTKERDQLQTSYNTLTKERDQLQTSYNNLTKERDQLQTSYNPLAKERDQLKQYLALKGCSQGWVQFGCSCYYHSTEKKTWGEGRQYCQDRGADLMILNSLEEQAFINGFYEQGVYSASWIGLTTSVTEGNWTWVDGTTLNTPTRYWLTGQPVPGNTINCIYLFLGCEAKYTCPKGWVNFGCNNPLKWICEK